MAQLDHISNDATSGPDIRPIPEAMHDLALMLLLTGRRHGSRQVIDQFRQFMRQQKIKHQFLFGAFENDQLVNVCLLLPSSGKTAMCFLNPLFDDKHVSIASQLVAEASTALDLNHTRMLQCLLDPAQTRERNVLEQAGFERLATLLYLTRTMTRLPQSWALPGPIEKHHLQFAHWTPENESLFQEAIQASYVETQDCPGLVGLRDIEDVIEGHMSTGNFDPDLWTVWHHEGKPQAVVLLAEIRPNEAYELVYLGVSSTARGYGIGTAALQRGMLAIAARHARQLFLAVDDANEPARRLYQGLGFRSVSEKLAMIKKICPAC